ncbi:MAG: riboflavin synthase, partial [Paeniglutamicibacter terrestris]
MFTGIISGMGRIEGIEATPETDSVVLRISAPEHTENLELGGSIAVNGVCLTATSITGDILSL